MPSFAICNAAFRQTPISLHHHGHVAGRFGTLLGLDIFHQSKSYTRTYVIDNQIVCSSLAHFSDHRDRIFLSLLHNHRRHKLLENQPYTIAPPPPRLLCPPSRWRLRRRSMLEDLLRSLPQLLQLSVTELWREKFCRYIHIKRGVSNIFTRGRKVERGRGRLF